MTPHQNPDHTSDHTNSQIDRVLNALRDATPPTGMDRRILNVLEAQSSRKGVIPSEAKSRNRRTPVFQNARTATFLRWTPTAAIAALAVVALITLTTRRTPSPTTTGTHHIDVPTLTRQATIPQPIPPIHRTIAPAHPIPPQHVETAPLPLIEDAQISHPAPPIPITDQERILLRYARRGRTEDLAQISNDSKTEKEQREAADFQAFFFEPPIKIGESE
jgi:hypothetical protein